MRPHPARPAYRRARARPGASHRGALPAAHRFSRLSGVKVVRPHSAPLRGAPLRALHPDTLRHGSKDAAPISNDAQLRNPAQPGNNGRKPAASNARCKEMLWQFCTRSAATRARFSRSRPHQRKKKGMGALPEPPADGNEKRTGNSAGPITSQRIYVYNMDENKTPGGLKVRVKIRVVTGPEATRLDARQAEAILELLRWAHRHSRRPHDPGPHEHAVPARSAVLAAPPDPVLPGMAAARLPRRGLLLGHRIGRDRPGRPQQDHQLPAVHRRRPAP